MTDKEALVKSAKYKRFPVENGALVVLRSSSTKAGRIVNIGMDGLTFRYVSNQKVSNHCGELSIFSADTTFALYNVPCEIISDLKAYNSHSSPTSIRQCDVQFGKLTKDQRSRLQYFIKHHTTGEA